MAESPVRKLAVLLHADVVSSTALVQLNETIAHERMRDAFLRFSEIITSHSGMAHEIRGDALIAEFSRASDAVSAALGFQVANTAHNENLIDEVRPVFRVGIALGEVVVADNTVTGVGVVLAQRLEQLANAGGVCIQGAAYETVPKRLPFDYENLGEQNLKGFDEPVRAYGVTLKAGETISEANSVGQSEKPILQLPDKPSIAVLPFLNMSSDVEQEYFADGLVDDIITVLSKLSGLLVIARDSSAVYKTRRVDVRQVARELSVRYVLEGSVRNVGTRLRINVQLTDAESGTNIWAERYDRTMGDIFAIQDEITLRLATEMQVQFTEGEQARLQYTTTHNVEAWTEWLKGLSHYRGPVTKESTGQARICWERAVALDPKSASLNAWLGQIHCVDARNDWWEAHDVAMQKATAYIDKALELDIDDPYAHRSSSFLLLLQGKHGEAVAEARKSIELAPSSADISSTASFVFCCSDLAEEAVVETEKSLRLHPNHPAAYLGILGTAYRLAGRFDEAIAAFKAFDERSAGFGLVDLVILYQQLARSKEAESAAAQLLTLRPQFSVRAWADTQFLADVARLESEIEALVDSGLPYDS